MTKMSYRYFSIITLIFRTVGIAATIFLAELLPSLNLGLVEYVILVNLVLLDIYSIQVSRSSREIFSLNRI